MHPLLPPHGMLFIYMSEIFPVLELSLLSYPYLHESIKQFNRDHIEMEKAPHRSRVSITTQQTSHPKGLNVKKEGANAQ